MLAAIAKVAPVRPRPCHRQTARMIAIIRTIALDGPAAPKPKMKGTCSSFTSLLPDMHAEIQTALSNVLSQIATFAQRLLPCALEREVTLVLDLPFLSKNAASVAKCGRNLAGRYNRW